MSHLIVDIEGTQLNLADQEILRHPDVAGIILFSRNFESIAQLKQLTTSIRKIRSGFIIAVDQEGGRVQRFLQGFTKLPAMRHWGETYNDNPDAALQGLSRMTQIMAQELSDAGINLNLTPVLDIEHQKNLMIGERSFHSNPEHVTHLAETLISQLHRSGFPVIGKHFPGHGGVAADSHLDLPVDDREWEILERCDMLPFNKLAMKLDGIMPAHIIFSKIDKNPVTFSSFWLQEILRQRLQFKGVIISDDLSMKGAASLGSYSDRAQRAKTAGCDLLLLCNNRSGVEEVLASGIESPDSFSEKRVAMFIQKLK